MRRTVNLFFTTLLITSAILALVTIPMDIDTELAFWRHFHLWGGIVGAIIVIFATVGHFRINALKEMKDKKMRDEEKAEKKPDNTMKIDSGASGIQNNAPNYGPQAGRDLYIGKERELTTLEIREILSGVAKYISDFNLNKTISISMSQESNGRKVVLQLADALKKAGYTVYTGGIVMSSEPIQGIHYNYGAEDKNMVIQVGIIPDPE